MASRSRALVIVVTLAVLVAAIIAADVGAPCPGRKRPSKCWCNGFGVYSSVYRGICNEETGICNCNTTLHVDGDHCDVCETGFANENGTSEPGNEGCEYTDFDFNITFTGLSESESLLDDAALDPNGERLTITTKRLKRFTLHAPVGVVSSDKVSVSASHQMVSAKGLPKHAEALGILNMSAVSEDIESEFELFGRTFHENVKLEIEIEKQFEDDVVYPYLIDPFLLDTRKICLEATGLAAGMANSTSIQFFTTSLTQVVLISVARKQLSQWISSHSIHTGFKPQQNGWPLSASFLWPTYNGMTIFARWFYIFREETLQSASKEWSTDTLDRMLTLLQVRCSNPPPQTESLSDLETVKILVHALFVSHVPQLIWMEKSDGLGILPGHAVLVYKYRMGEFAFYDPQFANEEQTLSFDFSTEKFVPYSNGGFNRFRVYSHRAFHLSYTDMETIYNQTVTAFNDSNAPDIVLDPFDNNITTNSIIVSGRIVPKPGQPMPAVLFSYILSNDSEERAVDRGRASVDSSGRFTKVLLDIVSESSKIVFVAGGYVPSRDNPRTRREIYLSYVPQVASLYHRHGFTQHHIYRSGNPNLLTVALMWDDGASDIDLHVLEPGGRHVYYNNEGGEGTPFLDYDNTAGYGPEHYIVDSDFRAASGGTLEGTYKIRVHYFADNGGIEGRSIRWSLKIQGTTQDSTTRISGVLRKSNSGSSSQFLSSDSSWSPIYKVTIEAVNFIAIADRRVDYSLGIAYHYSAQLWRNVLVLPNKQTEERVSVLQKYNPMARKEGGVELLREASSSSCTYRGWRLRRKTFGDEKCWKAKNVAVSRIHYSERGTRYIPIFTSTDWNVVQAKWNKMMSQARTYPYAEQPGPIVKYPQSIYYIGDDVNNSNTFIRWLFESTSLPYKEMRKAHPGRYSPLPTSTRSFQGTVFCGESPTEPPLTEGEEC